jgi:hypothetical protein
MYIISHTIRSHCYWCYHQMCYIIPYRGILSSQQLFCYNFASSKDSLRISMTRNTFWTIGRRRRKEERPAVLLRARFSQLLQVKHLAEWHAYADHQHYFHHAMLRQQRSMRITHPKGQEYTRADISPSLPATPRKLVHRLRQRRNSSRATSRYTHLLGSTQPSARGRQGHGCGVAVPGPRAQKGL